MEVAAAGGVAVNTSSDFIKEERKDFEVDHLDESPETKIAAKPQSQTNFIKQKQSFEPRQENRTQADDFIKDERKNVEVDHLNEFPETKITTNFQSPTDFIEQEETSKLNEENRTQTGLIKEERNDVAVNHLNKFPETKITANLQSQTEFIEQEQNFEPNEENRTQSDFIKQELNFDIDPNDPLTKASLSDHPVDEWMDILGSGQLKKKVLKAGKRDTRPNRADLCLISYTAKLEDGTLVEEAEDFMFQLGDVEVIQGLDLAIVLMDTEEEAAVEVSPRFAYGSLGRSAIESYPEIPPDATLTYNITLKSVIMEPELDSIPINKKREIGNKKKERGNWWFGRKEYSQATQCYRRALEYLSLSGENAAGDEKSQDVEPVSDADLQALLDDSLVVHNNLAAAQMQCDAYDAALTSVENVLRCQPLNVKALFRKGKILHIKLEHAKALAVLLEAFKIDPDNKAIQKELEILKKKSAKDAEHEKNLYRKMLGTNNKKKIENDEEDTKKVSSNTKWTWSLLGGTIAAVVGIVAYRFMS